MRLDRKGVWVVVKLPAFYSDYSALVLTSASVGEVLCNSCLSRHAMRVNGLLRDVTTLEMIAKETTYEATSKNEKNV